MSDLRKRLLRAGVQAHTDEPLAGYTGLKVGGPAEILARPATAEQTARTLLLANEAGAEVIIMGRGTNLLIGDGGFRGLVVFIGDGFENNAIRLEDERCTAAAGVGLLDLLDQLCQAGLGGLEDLYGIPGSLGGALAMNAGSYGTEIWPRVAWIEAALPSGGSSRLEGNEIVYGYRAAALPEGSAVTRVELVLERGDPQEIQNRCRERMSDRKHKHPLERPNCGSVFKNPAWEPGMDIRYEKLAAALGGDFTRRNLEAKGSRQLPAWRLIDACGLTGRRIGGAQVSTKHSNFMVNLGGARAADFAALIDLAQRTVRKNFGIGLETEVRLLGEFDQR